MTVLLNLSGFSMVFNRQSESYRSILNVSVRGTLNVTTDGIMSYYRRRSLYESSCFDG